MPKSTRSRLLLVLTLGAVTPAWGQRPVLGTYGLHTGDVVRVAYPCRADSLLCPPARALFVARAWDTLVVRSVGESLDRRIPLGLRTEVELLDGQRSRTGEGFAFGLLAGLAGGFVAAELCRPTEDRQTCRVFSYVIGVPLGAAVGALIGGTISTERWRPVWTQGRDVAIQAPFR